MTTATVVDVGTWSCWAVMGAVWAAGAARRRPAATGDEPVRTGSRDWPSLLAAVLGVAAATSPASVWHPLTVRCAPLQLCGVAVLAFATALTVWARIALGGLWSSGAEASAHHAFRRTGPYAVTRHPVYSGVLLMLLGTALAQGLGRWAVLLVAVAALLLAKIRAEEQVLTRTFPGAYERYREQVPALVPRLPRL